MNGIVPCKECGAAVLDEELHNKYHTLTYGILTDLKDTIRNILEVLKRITS